MKNTPLRVKSNELRRLKFVIVIYQLIDILLAKLIMNTNLNYKVLFVKSEEISVNFFIDQLGFKMYQKIEINGKICPMLQNANKDLMAFMENTGKDEINILNTDDCLRDYYFFKQKNIQTLGKPQYHHKGLKIDFNDPSGSRFVLLEERDYTDA